MQLDECSTVTVIPRHHESGDLSQFVNLTANDNDILDVITRKEYELLTPYM
jgi:hypothetical protein